MAKKAVVGTGTAGKYASLDIGNPAVAPSVAVDHQRDRNFSAKLYSSRNKDVASEPEVNRVQKNLFSTRIGSQFRYPDEADRNVAKGLKRKGSCSEWGGGLGNEPTTFKSGGAND